MNILCKLFGHRANNHSYGRLYGSTVDGIGREHGFYWWDCDRCGKERAISLSVHIPKSVQKETP